ncbi:cardiac-enriched FHL2-interacting protein [Discoglossus pictus]
MLRYKKHKRQTDGLGNGVGVMDDADREVSSFTDRAFRSLCVAEEEQYNDVPHVPSPIRGMALSTKYHLGIFNLSVRKTQPLAQLPTLPGQRGKWAPTFQPLLNRVRDGLTNINKLNAPEPRGYRQRSKVSSLIKTFDNIENEQPGEEPLQFRLPIPKTTQKSNLDAEDISSVTAIQIDSQNELPDTDSQRSMVLRRTARDVYLESQTDKCSILSGSPCSLGSPLLDPPKKTIKQKEPLRRSSFLHSENSAFKSWSDLNKRTTGGEESDSSIPGTPPIFGFTAPGSPLLQRVISGTRTREAGLEIGLGSPASTVSSSYDAVQMLKTVPPLPSKKLAKQSKESSHRTGAPRIPLEARIQEEEMQVDAGSPLSDREHSKWTRIHREVCKSRSSPEFKQEPFTTQRLQMVSAASCSPTKMNEEVHTNTFSPKQARKPVVSDKGYDVSLTTEHRHSSGRIKTIIQQMEATGEVQSPRLSEHKHGLRELPSNGTTGIPPSASCAVPTSSKALHQGTSIVPLQGTNCIPPQDISHIPLQGTSNTPLQVNSHVISQDTNNVTPRGKSHTFSQGTGHVPSQNTSFVPLKSSSHIMPQDTSHFPPQGTSHVSTHDHSHIPKQGASHLLPQSPSHFPPHCPIQGKIHVPFIDGSYETLQSTSHVPPQAASHVPPQGTSHVPPQGTSHVPPQGASHIPTQGASHVPPQSASHAHPQSASHVPPQGASHVPPQGASHLPPQGASHVPPQVTSHVPPQDAKDTSDDLSQGTSHVPPKGTSHVASQITSNIPPQGTSNIPLQDTSCVPPHDTSIIPAQGPTHIPPWRRTKVPPRSEPGQTIHREEAAEMSTDKDDFKNEKPTSSSFNITNLLTPVIRRKNIKEALDELPMMITPPPTEVISIKEQDPKEVNVYRSRDDYKSKATSLLFNIKDMRKRVKSTYNPATTMQKGIEKSHMGDGRAQEDANVSSPGLESDRGRKRVTETETLNPIPSLQNLRQVEKEGKIENTGNVADNYLSLSSPKEVMETLAYENRETIQEETQKDIIIPEINMASNKLNHLEEKIRKVVDYPSLSLDHNEDGAQHLELKENSHTDLLIVQKQKSYIPPQVNMNIEESNQNGCWREATNLPTIDGNPVSEYIKEIELENVPVSPEQSNLSNELDTVRNNESEGDEKRKTMEDDVKDELQYYAVSSNVIEDSRGSDNSGNERKKVDEKEALVSDTQSEEVAGNEDQRLPPITPLKPNLFHIKDNKIKSSPVTKSVRLPLLRSRSEDSLVCRKEEVINHSADRCEVEKVKSTMRENMDINLGNICTDNGTNDIFPNEKICKLISMRPASETPKQDNRVYNQMRKQRVEAENLELLRKLCSLDAEWRKKEKAEIEETKVDINRYNTNSPGLDGPFFHPVETCVSEVTGLSPECNTLLAQNVGESMKDLENGDLVDSHLVTAESPNYSPLDNGLLQFEDAVAFTEDIACSTINSPMSESVTCSMVASPMSVNTQSSGFTTALSALEDLPSPAVTHSRNGTFPFPNLDKTVSSLPGNPESQATECIKPPQEKAPAVETQNMHAGKPPAVPPKTEKALRRAKRLTKKRRKIEGPLRIHDGEDPESESVLDVPSPGNITPSSMVSPANSRITPGFNSILRPEGFRSASSTPSFPITQRKLLQDPDSGQYFVVDIPVNFKMKTFYDPETGKYLQVSLPPSERETPTLETLNNQFMLYPGLPTLSISSISPLKGASVLPAPGGLENETWEEIKEHNDFSKQYIETAYDSHDQSMTGTPQSMDRNMSLSRSPDIISMKDLDDFAMEAIS